MLAPNKTSPAEVGARIRTDAPVVEIEYGTAVLTTLDRTLADAYIAGYDLATSQYNR